MNKNWKRILSGLLCLLICLTLLPAARAEETEDLSITAEPEQEEESMEELLPEELAWEEEDPAMVLPQGAEILASESSYATDPVTIGGYWDYDLAFQVLALVNQERAAVGLPALVMDADLLEAAAVRAAEASLLFSHTRPDGRTCFSAHPKVYGENIAAGSATAEGVMYQWMNSQGHRENILRDGFESIGIGCFVIDGVHYWAQCFNWTAYGGDCAQPENRSGTQTVYLADGLEEGEFQLALDPESLSLLPGEARGIDVLVSNPGMGGARTRIYPTKLTWESSSDAVASVTNGTVLGVSEGKTKVTVSTESGLFRAELPVEVLSARCGENLTWEIRDGALVISGTGAMDDYEQGAAPWTAIAGRIRQVVIGEGVTHVGAHAFDTLTAAADYIFLGDRPSFGEEFYATVRVAAFYPRNNSTWTGSDLPSVATMTWLPDVEEGGCGENLQWKRDFRALSITGTGDMQDFVYGGEPWHNAVQVIDRVDMDPEITGIGSFAFPQIGNLSELTLPASLTRIGMYAFYYCYRLETLEFPAGLQEIGDEAFGACFGLKTLRFNGSAPSFGSQCFERMEATAYYPADDPSWTEDLRQDYGGTIEWVSYERPVALVYGTSIDLDGSIGLNVYLQLPKEITEDPNAYVTVDDQVFPLASAEPMKAGTLELWKFKVLRAAPEMNKTALLRVYDGEGLPVTLQSRSGETIKDYTVKGFEASVQAYLDTARNAGNEKLKALVNAMSDYGSCAQLQFGTDLDKRAEMMADLSQVTLETLAPYAQTVERSEAGKNISVASNLLVQSDTIIREYVILPAGMSRSDLRFLLDGQEVEPQRAGSYWYVEIPNIPGARLDKVWTLALEKDGEIVLSTRFSALSYCYTVLNSSQTDTLKNLVRAIYLYNQAANAYFGK